MRQPGERRYPRRNDSRLGGAALVEVDAALAHREGVAALVRHALSTGRWVLVRAGWQDCHGGFVYHMVLGRPGYTDFDHPDLDEVTLIMRLPPEQTSSELVLARTAAAAVTTSAESVRRWLTAATPPGRSPG